MGDQLQVFPKTEILLVIYVLTKQLSVLCTWQVWRRKGVLKAIKSKWGPSSL